jgi:hypothetical protein
MLGHLVSNFHENPPSFGFGAWLQKLLALFSRSQRL